MSVWFGINIIVLILALWKLSTGTMAIHILFGTLAFFILLYNWTRHAFFSTIRSNIPRPRKIKFATFSKKVLPYHKWTGSIAFSLMIVHVFLILSRFGFQPSSMKMWAGLFAAITFTGVALFGWLRWYRTTVFRRYVHWVLAFILFFTAVFHVFV